MRPTLLGVLRTAYVLVAALVVATVLPRLGVPPRWVPDLVLLGVVATAVLRGPVHGALVGLSPAGSSSSSHRSGARSGSPPWS